jgi:hypothetical protein
MSQDKPWGLCLTVRSKKLQEKPLDVQFSPSKESAMMWGNHISLYSIHLNEHGSETSCMGYDSWEKLEGRLTA